MALVVKLSLMISFLLLALAPPALATNTQCGADDGRTWFGLPSWDRGLGSCEDLGEISPQNPDKLKIIIANVSNIVIRLAGLIAVGFIIFSGFKFVLSSGNSDQAAQARQTGINALIGLAIAVFATTIVEIISQRLYGTSTPAGIIKQDSESIVLGLVSLAFVSLGVISVLMVTLQGIRYSLSQGDPKATEEAKNGIIYSGIGVAVAASSWSLVEFVLNRLVIPANLDSTAASGAIIDRIVGIMIFVGGVIAIIMVIINGFKYVGSGGDSNKTAEAQKGLIFSVVGLAIATLAGPIMSWMVNRL